MRSALSIELTRRAWSLFRFFMLVGLGFVILYPVLFMLSTSFRPLNEIQDPGIVWIPRTLTLSNFFVTFKAMQYMSSLLNTLTIGGVSSLLQIASCAVVGYGFARFRFRERSFLFALVMLTILVPPQTILIPLYLNYMKFSVPFLGTILQFTQTPFPSVNMLDNNLVFYLPAALGMGIRSGLYIYVFRQFFRGLPVELEEAATIDGCGPVDTFLRVMAPNASSAFLTIFLFSVVWYWNDYFNTVMFLSTRMTLSVALSNLRLNLKLAAVNIYDPFEVVAKLQMGSLLLMVPLLVVYLFAQRYFTQSIERTGIVG